MEHHGMHPAVRVLKKDSAARLPEYASEGAAGADIRARLDGALVIPPLGRAVVPTALAFEIPSGYEVQIRPRSGLAAKHGITVLNSPGTIDSDYRGELRIILVNLGEGDYTVNDGDRIAQMIVAPVVRAVITEAESLTETRRSGGGFGSTGTS
jgi:dUTP pyrophosphatase